MFQLGRYTKEVQLLKRGSSNAEGVKLPGYQPMGYQSGGSKVGKRWGV